METFRGYMVEAAWDGHTLRARGTNKVSQVALLGEDHGQGEAVIPRGSIASVTYRKANPVVNGNLVVTTNEGRRYQLHFRRKSSADFARLHWLLTH